MHRKILAEGRSRQDEVKQVMCAVFRVGDCDMEVNVEMLKVPRLKRTAKSSRARLDEERHRVRVGLLTTVNWRKTVQTILGV